MGSHRRDKFCWPRAIEPRTHCCVAQRWLSRRVGQPGRGNGVKSLPSSTMPRELDADVAIAVGGLVDLGAAHRVAGERPSARGVLRKGLDLADRIGAVVLADRARKELVATGARPRRAAASGV